MPKLLLFVPCEKLLVDENGNPTLVCLIQTIGLQIKKDVEVPEQTVAPREWDIVTLWEPLEGEQGAKFAQHIELVLPDGRPSPIASRLEFQMGDRSQRNKVHIIGFPVGRVGNYTLKMRLEALSPGVAGYPEVSYPIQITHERI
jgi:hypothetical protein